MITAIKQIMILLILFFTVSYAANTPAKPTEIVLASDNWHKLTMTDGSGLYFDLIRAVYEPIGIRVKFIMSPYARTVTMVEKKIVDGWVASFENEQTFPLYPKWHFDRNRQLAVSLKSDKIPCKSVENLRGKSVIWLRDFNLDKYIHVPMKFQEIDEISGMFSMLEAHRASYFIGAETDIREAAKSNKIDTALFSFDFLMNLKLYVAFANTQRGKQFKTIWDSRMEKLHSDPAFRKIYVKYGYPIPFD